MQTEVALLLKKKDQLEAQLHELENQISAISKAHDFEKGTVDAEGFPRADLDFGELSNYKNLKKRKAQLNNDHFALMKQIEKRLHELHETFPQVDPSQQEVVSKEQQKPRPEKKKQEPVVKEAQKKPHNIDYITPFAKLTHVDADSPASKAGLKTGDFLSQFSEVSIYSIEPMKQIPKHVQQGRPINVVVMREVTDEKTEGEGIFKMKDGKYYRKITVQVVPHPWQGRGMLGCKIDPLIQ